jgi:hypothetical protein
MSVERQFQTSVCQMKTKYSLASSARRAFDDPRSKADEQ